MSATNILEYSKTQTSEKFDEAIICLGNKHLMYTRFHIGSSPDLNDFTTIIALERILSGKMLECNFDIIREKMNRILDKYN